MSDDFITFVPADPKSVPSAERVDDAVGLAQRCFPKADSITPIRSQAIRFFDCGSNFEAVYCPGCGKELDLEWWGDMMDRDSEDDHYHLAQLVMSCCGRKCTLNDLRYDWQQAFGMFGLEIRNASVGALPESTVELLSSALGVPLKVIYSHL